jgi:SAM-dependent methyltransferase
METTAELNRKFLEEYGTDTAVRKYTTNTAGYGVNYLLRNDYARLYLDVVGSHLQTLPKRPLRLLEFGCGGGMNIIRLLAILDGAGVPVERAYGTDFSPRLLQAAQQEARAFLPRSLGDKLSFHVAQNENLAQDLAQGLGSSAKALAASFDLVVGVNTFRFCHRLKKAVTCAQDIHRLLRTGGVCIMIDMNTRFPAFRSRLNGHDQRDPVASYVPTLEEYASPFETAGFELLRKENFCWVPHSAGRTLTFCCCLMAPLLNVVARNRAMRSLVVARRRA